MFKSIIRTELLQITEKDQLEHGLRFGVMIVGPVYFVSIEGEEGQVKNYIERVSGHITSAEEIEGYLDMEVCTLTK